MDGILQEQQGVKCGWSQQAKNEVEGDCGCRGEAKDYTRLLGWSQNFGSYSEQSGELLEGFEKQNDRILLLFLFQIFNLNSSQLIYMVILVQGIEFDFAFVLEITLTAMLRAD